jgi:Mrp family chromosome partitioning ATPase
MEWIAEAIERARMGGAVHTARLTVRAPWSEDLIPPDRAPGREIRKPRLSPWENAEILALDHSCLDAFNGADERARPFDVLRTQVLRQMEEKHWQILAVTAPTARCGTTTAATNLAFSIARQSERGVLLVDLNLRRPAIARYLGFKRPSGLSNYLEGSGDLEGSLMRVTINDRSVLVLPSFSTAPNSADLLSSTRMAELVQRFRRELKNTIVILDMPPLLSADGSVALSPHIDCFLLVTAAGQSTANDLDECGKHLASSNLAGVVLNKDHNLKKVTAR